MVTIQFGSDEWDISSLKEKTFSAYVAEDHRDNFITESIQLKGLNPVGIISAETVRACTPRREIFDEALRVSGLSAREVVHVGDSIASGVNGARAAGIAPVLLDRTGKQDSGDPVVISSLTMLNRLINGEIVSV